MSLVQYCLLLCLSRGLAERNGCLCQKPKKAMESVEPTIVDWLAQAVCVLSAPGGGDCSDAPDELLHAPMLSIRPESIIGSAVPAAQKINNGES